MSGCPTFLSVLDHIIALGAPHLAKEAVKGLSVFLSFTK